VRINLLKEFKRSNIGLLWLFILPVLSAIIWILLNGAGIIEPGSTGIPYPAYVLLSTSIWGFFAGIYKSTSNIYLTGGNIKIMTRFPFELLLAERLLVHLIRFIIPLSINIAVLLFFGIRFTWSALLFPLTLMPLLLLGLAIGLVVSIMRVLAIDISILVDYCIGFLMFLTPVVYAPDIKVSLLAKATRFNPLTYMIGFSRDILTKASFYEPVIWGACAVSTLIIFLFAVRIFMIAEPRVIERMINN
ncbi:MAG: ABC transporter permease, partial [Bacteroidetes bacterium]|nr:ABC transporter permease [Bacteroidota bacterium]